MPPKRKRGVKVEEDTKVSNQKKEEPGPTEDADQFTMTDKEDKQKTPNKRKKKQHKPGSDPEKAKLSSCKKSAPTLTEVQNTDEKSEVLLTGICGRCGSNSLEGRCNVPHLPPDKVVTCAMRSEPSNEGVKNRFKCQACKKFITIQTKNSSDNSYTTEVLKGPKFCSTGEHISTPSHKSDKHRINISHIEIDQEKEGDIQPKIETILHPDRQSDVKSLILSRSGFKFKFPVTLNHRMTNLTELSISDIKLTTLHLNAEMTPSLTSLEIKSISDNCDFKVIVPTLEKISIKFFSPERDSEMCSDGINDMLAAATNLKMFISYKLWVSGQLKFASNKLEIIDLWRSDGLQSLTFWAPNLKELNLQACYSLSKIKFLQRHKLQKDLPVGHKLSVFTVNTLNAVLSRAAIRSLENSGRCIIEGNVADDSDAGDGCMLS